MNLNDVLAQAPRRTSTESFKGLFEVETLLTTNEEIKAALKAAAAEKLNPQTGGYETEIDQDRLRAWLKSRVAGFNGLTLRRALTLCCRSVPDEHLDGADAPLAYSAETVDTLLRLVVGLQTWLMGQLSTAAESVARREADAAKN